jgi:hypothetical protein
MGAVGMIANFDRLRRKRGQRDPVEAHDQKQQMHWNRWTVQPFLAVRIAVLNNTLGGSFTRVYPAFPAENDNRSASVAA